MESKGELQIIRIIVNVITTLYLLTLDVCYLKLRDCSSSMGLSITVKRN